MSKSNIQRILRELDELFPSPSAAILNSDTPLIRSHSHCWVEVLRWSAEELLRFLNELRPEAPPFRHLRVLPPAGRSRGLVANSVHGLVLTGVGSAALAVACASAPTPATGAGSQLTIRADTTQRAATRADSARGRELADLVVVGDSTPGLGVTPRSPLVAYPRELRNAFIQGGAILAFVVDTNGRVVAESRTVVMRSDHVEFERAACNFLLTAQFEYTDRLPVRTIVFKPFFFQVSISNGPPSGPPPRAPALPRQAVMDRVWAMMPQERASWFASKPSCSEL